MIFAGGGLANGLIAYRLCILHPELKILIVDGEERLGGNHTWSFHSGDLTRDQWEWIKPLVRFSWEGHSVRFPKFERKLNSGYHSLLSKDLHYTLYSELGKKGTALGRKIQSVLPHSVSLDDGTEFTGKCIIDGRGMPSGSSVPLAYQKFLGLDLVLKEPHGLKAPVLMDSTVEQKEGFRFIYLLPWNERSLLVEDTRYSNSPHLDRDSIKADIEDYLKGNGWEISELMREEKGALPLPLGSLLEDLWPDLPPFIPRVGVGAGLFHPTTSYSLPSAVRMAEKISGLKDLRTETVHPLVRSEAKMNWKRGGYFRLLNRLLFKAALPENRYQVLQKFYELNPELISRFYAGRLTAWDKARILIGKPPVPISKAITSLLAK